MSTRSKGRRTLNKAKEWYEQRGWLVDEVEKTGRFRKHKDLFSTEEFGGFDLIGIRKGTTILIQVKTNRPPSLEDYSEWAGKHAGARLLVESWTWYDFRGSVVHRFFANGKIKRTDYRGKQ